MRYAIAGTIISRLRCYALRHKIYCCQKCWLPKKPHRLEFDRHDRRATHIMALDANALVGYLRIIPGPDLPIRDHPNVGEIPHGAEISRLMFLPDYTDWDWIRGLFRAAYRHSRAQGIRRWFVVAERSLLRVMRNQGFRFSPVGQPAEYFGGQTIPAVLDLAETEARIRRRAPDLYRWFTEDE